MNAATDTTSTAARRLKIAAIIIVAIVCLPVTIAVLIASVKGTR